MNACPAADDLSRFLSDALPAEEAAAIHRHVEACHSCQAALDKLSDDAELRRWAEGDPAAADLAASDRAATTQPFGGFDTGQSAPAGPATPVIAGYEVLRELGRGGMGVVYEARDLRLKRVVALKMIRTGAGAGPDELARFRLEAEAVARLRHVNIVQIYEIGEHEGSPFFALELIEGGSLARQLATAALAPRAAARLLHALALGVQHAHEQGILHRDLKPANILLHADSRDGPVQPSPARPESGSDPIPKITDFGLAKRLGEDDGQTRTGAVMGTPSYMAPEQALGKTRDVGPAADVYALGAILYESLTGRPPFKGASVLETLEQVRYREPVPPTQLQPNTPRDLESICLKCLRKDPRQRYATAQALADDLQRFVEGRPISARPIGALERSYRWCRRNPWPTAMVATLSIGMAVSACLAWEAMRERDRADGETVRADLRADDARKAQAKADQESKAARLAEGVAAAKAKEVQQALGHFVLRQGVRHLSEGDFPRALLYFAEQLARDADNDATQRAARIRLATHWRYAPRLTLTRLLEHSEGAVQLLFSLDGRRLVIVGGKTTRVLDTATWTPAFAPLAHQGPVAWASVSKDSKLLLTSPGFSGGDVAVWNLANGKPVGPPIRAKGDRVMADFSPDGRLIAVAHGPLVQLYDTAKLMPLGQPIPHEAAVTHVAFSPDGRRLASVTANNRIPPQSVVFLHEVATRKPAGKTAPLLGFVDYLAFNQKGDRFILHCDPRRSPPVGGNTELLWRLLPFATVGSTDPGQAGVAQVGVFDARGARVAIPYNGRYGVVNVLNATDGELVSRYVAPAGHVSQVEFSPEGRYLAGAFSDHRVHLWDADTGRRHLAPLPHPDPVHLVAFSPDGAALVTVSGTERSRVHVWQYTGGRPAQARAAGPLKSAGNMTAVSADGRRVVRMNGQQKKLEVYDSQTGKPAGPAILEMARVRFVRFDHRAERILVCLMEGERPGSGFHTRLQIHDIATGKIVGEPMRGVDFEDADLAADNRLLLTRNESDTHGEMRIWDLQTGKALGPPLVHPYAIWHGRFSPSGRFAASANSTVAQVWDLASNQPLTPPLERPGPNNPNLDPWVQLGFDDEHTLVLTRRDQRRQDVWDLSPEKGPTAALVRRAQVLAGHRLDGAGGEVPLSAVELRQAWDEVASGFPGELDVGARERLTWLCGLARQKSKPVLNHLIGLAKRETESGSPAAGIDILSAVLDQRFDNDPAPHFWRAKAHARQYAWQAMKKDLTAAIALHPGDRWHRADLAGVCLYLDPADKARDYRRQVDAIWRRFDEKMSDWERYSHVIACLYLPKAAPDHAKVLKAAQDLAARDDAPIPWRFALPFAQVRASLYDVAFKTLEKHRAVDKRHFYSSVHNDFLSAIALHHLGKAKESRARFDVAAKRMDRDLPTAKVRDLNAYEYNAWFLCHVLRREGERVLSR